MAYFLANTASQVPLLTIVSITFGCISYWMIGLYPDVWNFLNFLLIISLVNFVGDSICMFVSSLVNELSVANALGSLFMAFFLLFGGFFIKKNDVPFYWQWANYTSFFKYCFEALLINEFSTETFSCSSDEIDPNTGQCFIPDGHSFLKQNDLLNTFSFEQDALMLVVLFVLFKVLNLCCLHFLNKEKR